jgi:hypothetical protein
MAQNFKWDKIIYISSHFYFSVGIRRVIYNPADKTNKSQNSQRMPNFIKFFY